MKKAKLTINTQVDEERERTASFEAEMELTENSAFLSYKDGESFVTLTLKGGEVFIRREGDYTLDLHLIEGQEMPATLGIMGNEGGIKTKTREINYSVTRSSVLLSIKYSLLFSREERQEMKLRLMARF